MCYLSENVSIDEAHPSSQIRPSDRGYGFTLEERNRVPIIKSVEKGSPAEVRSRRLVRVLTADELFFQVEDNRHQRDGPYLLRLR